MCVTSTSCFHHCTFTGWQLFDLATDRKLIHSSRTKKKKPTHCPLTTQHTHTDGRTAWSDFPLRHLLWASENKILICFIDSSFMDWVTKYHITCPPDTHYSLGFLLGYGVHSVPQVVVISPWHQAAAWEAHPRDWGEAEGLNVWVQPPPFCVRKLNALFMLYSWSKYFTCYW